MNCKVVIIEGIIGCGKSTLADELGEALSKHSGLPALVLQEPDEQDNANPYLDDFYGDKARWAFTMQAHLLQARWRMHRLAQEYALGGLGHAVLDRSYFGDTAFARLQVRNKDMSDREFATYSSLYHAMTEIVLLPNVCIRLLVSPEVANERIARRAEKRDGRKEEAASVDLGYLKSLDREITHMCGVLQSMGVKIIDTPWDVDKYTEGDRRRTVNALASRIVEYEPPDLFLDLHRRTV